MENFIQFLVNYWQYISIGLVVLLEIILMFVKKKKVEVFDHSLTATLVELIKNAESKFGCGHGSEKLEYVISEIQKFQPELTDSTIKFFVDQILTTPTKKGGFGREQIEQKSK